MQMRRLWLALWVWFGTTAIALANESVLAVEGEAAVEKAPPSVFTGSVMESIWTLIWFVLLIIVLWRVAWKPLLKALQARQDHIQKEIDDAEKSHKQAQQVLDEYRSKLADAERQGREIINQRVKQAQVEAKEVEIQNRQQIEHMKVRFDADIEREKIDAQEQLWQQAGEIVQKLGQEVFGKTLTDQDNQRLIQQAIERLKQVHQPPAAGG
jgi:F-type H+-transporting ATPase subunit b